MKQAFSLILFSIAVLFTNAQRIAKVTIAASSSIESMCIATDDAVVIINQTGAILNYGVEYFSEKIPNYSRIENYTGRVENYTTYDDKAYQGKLKYLGRAAVTYYASYDLASLQGKIKSIGNLVFTYYQDFEDESLKGKIKSIGSTAVNYYSSFENDAIKGKVKSIGNTSLVYFGSFEDAALRGKIKSIGQSAFTYYTSFEKQNAGALKTGNRMQNINGITYLMN